MQRRGVLRLLTLSGLAVLGAPALVSCGDSPSCGRGSGCGNTAPPPGDVELVSSRVARAPGDPAAVPEAVGAMHVLGGGILGALGDAPGNLALSPYSIGVALALTLNGAVGETQKEIVTLLGRSTPEKINGGLDALTADIEALSGPVDVGEGQDPVEVELAAANALFGQRGEQWQQPFLDTLARSYGAGMQVVDYEQDVSGAVQAINTWTAGHTHHRITDIVTPDSIDDETRLVLVNALYFKAPWQTPFEVSATTPERFTTADGHTVSVPMMHTRSGFAPYATGDGWAATSLPYAGGRLAMTVVLPDGGRLDEVQTQVSAGRLPQYLAALQSAEVNLAMPRWTFRTAAALTKPLQAQGMLRAFDPDDADFSGMTTQDRLYVGAVLHQVFVAVDENGTEAAAATAVVAEAGAAPGGEPVELTLDRPFFFVIHDLEHGTPLFLGRVDDPTAG